MEFFKKWIWREKKELKKKKEKKTNVNGYQKMAKGMKIQLTEKDIQIAFKNVFKKAIILTVREVELKTIPK